MDFYRPRGVTALAIFFMIIGVLGIIAGILFEMLLIPSRYDSIYYSFFPMLITSGSLKGIVI